MRCVVVDKDGKIVNAIVADPEKDTIPGHRLMAHPRAETSWTYKDGKFIAPEMETAATVTMTPSNKTK